MNILSGNGRFHIPFAPHTDCCCCCCCSHTEIAVAAEASQKARITFRNAHRPVLRHPFTNPKQAGSGALQQGSLWIGFGSQWKSLKSEALFASASDGNAKPSKKAQSPPVLSSSSFSSPC